MTVHEEHEDLSWVSMIKYDHVVYSKTLAKGTNVHHQPINKGNEATAYMQYIVDHYVTLPEFIVVGNHDNDAHCILAESLFF